MRQRRTLILLLLSTLVAGSADAQTPPPSTSPEVVVTGRRSQPSNWREAETQHVIVLSNGSERELVRIAHDLEREFFLLSVLLNRVDKVDNTIKLRVTLIGDAAEFQAMDLRNLRWQQGPFNEAFDITRYYDPREDGAVMATTRIDQRAVLERGLPVSMVLQGLQLPGAGQPGTPPVSGGALFGLQSEPDLIPPVNEQSFSIPAQGMIQAGFAQHYLQTFFPAAYPRWYLDGFGQVFATMVARGEDMVEYGRAPVGSSAVLRSFGNYPLGDVLNGRYLEQPASRTRWTPVHAWMLTHFLFFSPTRSGQFRQYLTAIATGSPPNEAARLFGDLSALAGELKTYYRVRKPYEKVTFPADRADAPVVRRLTQSQAAFVKGRLELGSRVEIPPPPPADAAPALAKRITTARTRALADREQWLGRLRGDAARFSGDPGAQLLLAEAECRSGNNGACATAADRALALDPASSAALTWKGVAMARAAAANPVETRTAELRTARATIARANRSDTESVVPLLAYQRSFSDAGEPLPDIAVDALTKALTQVPNAPVTRLALGTALAHRDIVTTARATLRPVAAGAYDSPEREPAQAVIKTLEGK